MNEPRTRHACQRFNSPGLGEMIVVAGIATWQWQRTNTAEMYSVTEDTWAYASEIPTSMGTNSMLSFVKGINDQLMILESAENKLFV